MIWVLQYWQLRANFSASGSCNSASMSFQFSDSLGKYKIVNLILDCEPNTRKKSNIRFHAE